MTVTEVPGRRHGMSEEQSVIATYRSPFAIGFTMQKTDVQVFLSSCLCLFLFGCIRGTPARNLSQSSAESMNNDGRLVEVRHATAPYPFEGEWSTRSAVEYRIAERIESTLEHASAGSEPQSHAQAARKKLPSEQTSFHKERPRTVDVSRRNETLRVTNTAGDICAAVSISPQLAVTALHCARALCESPSFPRDGSPVGCKIDYELPNGTLGMATVVSTSESDLLALLELQQPLPKYGALYCDNPRATDRVYTVSHPGGENWFVSYGRLAKDPIALEWITGEATRVLVAEIPTKRGSSGGGLFDIQDRLVGVQIARWSPWTTDFGKAAFIQSSRIFNLAGRYCISQGSKSCVGLRCISGRYDIVSFDGYPGGLVVQERPRRK
jgi:hypothetical protein